MFDYYSILGLDRDCTREEIKSAYHRLAMQYHPDVNRSPDAADRFRKITEAYEYLLKVRDGEAPDVPGRSGAGSSRAYGGRPVEEIIASLNSQDRDVVRAAIEALGSRRFYDNSGVLNILAGYLRSPDVALRRSAALALGRLGNPAAIVDLAKLLRDGDPGVRFDAIVAMGNIGVPAALTYLEMMDADDPRNDAMVMNARRETVYSIRKKNRMYPASRMCPFCGGYDTGSRSAPFKCHECGRTFGRAEAQPEAHQGYGTRADEDGGSTEASRDCAICHSEGPLTRCEHCGQSYCRSHITPAAHQCRHTDHKPVEDRAMAGGRSLFRPKSIRDPAILSTLLFLIMALGMFMDQVMAGVRSFFRSKSIRNLAILAALLFLMMTLYLFFAVQRR